MVIGMINNPDARFDLDIKLVCYSNLSYNGFKF